MSHLKVKSEICAAGMSQNYDQQHRLRGLSQLLN